MHFKSAVFMLLVSSISAVYANPINAPAPEADKVRRTNEDAPAPVAMAVEPRDSPTKCGTGCVGVSFT
ncbi:unnamed protein product [Diplocarpon coronariae]|nr:hypothetical protein JHW43_002144 [Diplocarpon mali]